MTTPALSLAPSPTTPPKPLFPLDTNEIAVEINLRPNTDRPLWSRHTLRKPTLDQLAKRERETPVSIVEHGNEEEIQVDVEGPDSRLYDALFVSASGYRPNGELIEGADAAAKIPVAHKLAVVRGLFLSDETVVADDAEFFDLDKAGTIRIAQGIGPGETAPFELVHTFREPTSKERRQYREAAGQARIIRGKKQRTKILSNLGGVVALYDTLIQSVTGANADDPNVVKRSLDAPYKAKALAKAMTATEAALQD